MIAATSRRTGSNRLRPNTTAARESGSGRRDGVCRGRGCDGPASGQRRGGDDWLPSGRPGWWQEGGRTDAKGRRKLPGEGGETEGVRQRG